MANQYVQIQNNIIQFDNAVYGVSANQENGIPLVVISKLADSTVIACKIYNGTIIYWMLPVAQITIAAFLTGIKITIT